jgi:hypothetical protein
MFEEEGIADKLSDATILRKQSSGNLSSRFIAIHEPYAGDMAIISINRQNVSGNPNAVALKIKMNPARTLFLLHWTRVQNASFTDGNVV